MFGSYCLKPKSLHYSKSHMTGLKLESLEIEPEVMFLVQKVMSTCSSIGVGTDTGNEEQPIKCESSSKLPLWTTVT